MTVIHAIRMRNRWRAYWVKLVMFSAVLVISSTIAGNFHGNPSYAQIEPLNPGGIICPSEVTVIDGNEAIGTLSISNGSLSLMVGDVVQYEMAPDPDGFTQFFFSLLEINTDPDVVQTRAPQTTFVGTLWTLTALREGRSDITLVWKSSISNPADIDSQITGSCSLTVNVDGDQGRIQGQLHSAEPLESTDGVDVQNATVRLFQQEASVRDKAPDESIDDYITFLDDAGRTLVDTMQVTPADMGKVSFHDLPLVDDAQAPLLYTLQIEDAHTEVQDPNTPRMTRTVNFSAAAVPDLTAEVGDQVFTLEIRLIPLEGFEVNSTGDAMDLDLNDDVCDTGQLQSEGRPECTLRAAIEQANERAGRDLISFNIPGPPPYIITPLSNLPSIKDAVLIDGDTQPDFEPVVAITQQPQELRDPGSPPRLMETQRAMSVGMQEGVPDNPKITLDGINGGLKHGYNVKATNVHIRGIRIVNFPKAGIRLAEKSGKVTITGTIIGIGNDGTAQENGVGILVLSSGNTIGGVTQIPGKAPGNVLSGNLTHGIELSTIGAEENTIAGNIIGLDPTGTQSIPNGAHGVALLDPTGLFNTIGGTKAGEGNIITGNLGHGIFLDGGGFTNVLGNFIGLDKAGNTAMGNGETGVYILGSSRNVIGGTHPSAGNVISGNREGIVILGSVSRESSGNTIFGNLIGTDLLGTTALGNIKDGVVIQDASSNVIGGTEEGSRNLISGNVRHGVIIKGEESINTAGSNRVIGNLIGMDIRGLTALGNSKDGVFVKNATSTTIRSNFIGGNKKHGVRIKGEGAIGTLILRNGIGASETVAQLPNAGKGILVTKSASGTQIGSPDPSDANTILTGDTSGIVIKSGTKNTIFANTITNIDGAALPVDLGNNGITLNDLGDADTGPNDFQNFPSIIEAFLGEEDFTVVARLDSNVASGYSIRFFTCNAEFGTFFAFLGEIPDVDLRLSDTFTFTQENTHVLPGSFVTATATDSEGNTSEFSAPCRQVR